MKRNQILGLIAVVSSISISTIALAHTSEIFAKEERNFELATSSSESEVDSLDESDEKEDKKKPKEKNKTKEEGVLNAAEEVNGQETSTSSTIEKTMDSSSNILEDGESTMTTSDEVESDEETNEQETNESTSSSEEVSNTSEEENEITSSSNESIDDETTQSSISESEQGTEQTKEKPKDNPKQDETVGKSKEVNKGKDNSKEASLGNSSSEQDEDAGGITGDEEIIGDEPVYNFTRNISTEEFIAMVSPDAQELCFKSDLYASVLIAQAILETGSGSSQLSRPPYYNLFGIKGAYEGKAVNFKTQEDDGTGNLYTINSGFRDYPSYKESVKDYVALMRAGTDYNQGFYSGVWKSNTKNYQEATKFLTGRYATDTSYYAKLNALIGTYNLTKYDSKPLFTQNESSLDTVLRQNNAEKAIQKVEFKKKLEAISPIYKPSFPIVSEKVILNYVEIAERKDKRPVDIKGLDKVVFM
ncbi:MAG: glucosaminidase domain-containing protein [Lactobacillales bacterium]|jgi:flagellum-specific peptidoglycan hydrolase FlgJ|nr:glucosaminidase domain-containing protein [Lactobacillales bacterium]